MLFDIFYSAHRGLLNFTVVNIDGDQDHTFSLLLFRKGVKWGWSAGMVFAKIASGQMGALCCRFYKTGMFE